MVNLLSDISLRVVISTSYLMLQYLGCLNCKCWSLVNVWRTTCLSVLYVCGHIF